MGTTLADDMEYFDTLAEAYPVKQLGRGTGRLVFAGNYWPSRLKNALIYNDVEYAMREARTMVAKGYLTATAAIAGDAQAIPLMQRWFGARPVKPMNVGVRDWWVGARTIIGAVETYIVKDVQVLYRGDLSLIGKPTDHASERGTITSDDLVGYARTYPLETDRVIKLCTRFFKKQTGTGQIKMNLHGLDSVGGTLIHELSHNLCGTEDHEAFGGGTCYGARNCLELAYLAPSRAWYNADNIEYFCEEVHYGAITSTPTGVATGAKQTVAILRDKFEQKK